MCLFAICELCPGRLDVARISGLVVEYIVAIDVTRVRFPADALELPHAAAALPKNGRESVLSFYLTHASLEKRTRDIVLG